MIPAFDHNSVLPPHLGDPREMHHLSPYTCTIIDIVNRFATSKARVDILTSFINFRNKIRNAGVAKNAFQWIDGSFVEDIESLEARDPRDIDVLTVYFGYDPLFIHNVVTVLPEFRDPQLSKDNFSVDHYPLDISNHPYDTYLYVKYWTMLFTHNSAGIWKGILQIELDTQTDDDNALLSLNNWMP